MQPLFTWLHLSDIHFKNQPWVGQPLVLAQLRRAIAGRSTFGIPAPEAIFVTGDVANTGGARGDEYAPARDWLLEIAGELGLSAEHIHVVPGNHDLQRATAGTPGQVLVEALRNGTTKLDDVLLKPDSHALLHARMAPFLHLVRGLAPVEFWLDGIAWKRQLRLRSGVKVRVVGLNTALLANDALDFQRLRAGQSQLDFALADISTDEAVIVLGHHPFNWLADESSVEPPVSAFAHLYLNGHVHAQHSQRIVSGGGRELVQVVAGASFDSEHGARYSFNFGALLGEGTEPRTVRLWPLAWSQKNFDFRLDVDNTRPGSDSTDHPLRQFLARQVTHSTPPPTVPPGLAAPAPTPPSSSPTPAAYQPPLAVYVVWHPQLLEGEALARQLYGVLCREGMYPGARGTGIPVWFRSAPATSAGPAPLPIPLGAAQRTAIIALVDDNMMASRHAGWNAYLDPLMERSTQDPRVSVLPVAFSKSCLVFNTRHELSYHPLLEDQPLSAKWRKLREMVTHELCALLLTEPGKPPAGTPKVTAFLSHATRGGTDQAATLQQLLPDLSSIEVFFDKVDIRPGSSFRKAILGQLQSHGQGGEAVVLVAMQTDLYASRDWCQREVLEAKRNGLPILLVHRLDIGEERGFPYLGNVPSIGWASAGKTDAERAMTLREHILALALRDQYLRLHLRELCRVYGMNALQLTSPPELLTLAMRQAAGAPPVVVYPDPPLGEMERGILLQHDPNLVLLTPTLLPGWHARSPSDTRSEA
ncbi:TIR domain-containing protein [Corallococcus exiguus]|uniref:metallophosphoesterase n=1 Tax=Corallococcus exiguus TaxID=83462 RepID=UPI00147409F4|nr:metallophosphoesterase [Corallococcus exiguus]NNB99115.1 TIR domain-containing protein [Corallococcus exiguus]